MASVSVEQQFFVSQEVYQTYAIKLTLMSRYLHIM